MIDSGWKYRSVCGSRENPNSIWIYNNINDVKEDEKNHNIKLKIIKENTSKITGIPYSIWCIKV